MMEDDKRISSSDQRAALEKLFKKFPEGDIPSRVRSSRIFYRDRMSAQGTDIDLELARREKIKNDDAEQDIKLKRSTLNRLFLFLVAETVLIFIFAFCQAIYAPAKFHLEEWSFRLLVSATLLQITGMLFVAIRYLFPKR